MIDYNLQPVLTLNLCETRLTILQVSEVLTGSGGAESVVTVTISDQVVLVPSYQARTRKSYFVFGVNPSTINVDNGPV